MRAKGADVIVLPTYQEASNLPGLLAQLLDIMPFARVLVVDDASGDGAPEWIRGHAMHGTRLFLLERNHKLGLASALWAGYERALAMGADRIAQMDADFSHDPEDLPRLFAALDQGADLAIGSRYCAGGSIRQWAWWRKLLSRSAGRYVRLWTGLPVNDPTAGLRAFRARALEGAMERQACCDGYGFQVEMAHTVWKQGGAIREVPVVFTERREGKSKLSFPIILEAVFGVPRLRWRGRAASPKRLS
jgi:dolichol-phosphate mannosyltransferase